MISIPSIKRARTWAVVPVIAVALSLGLPAGQLASAAPHGSQGPRPTVVLVHGNWADGSSWDAVTKRLIDRGYDVVVPPNALRAPIDDGAALRSFLLTIPGPIVLVGHSYGGAVITNAATGMTNVKALVYIDAFIPDVGERLLDLVPGSCIGVNPLKVFNFVPVPGGVDLYLQTAPNPPYTGIAECFANGVDPQTTAVVAATQRPAAINQVVEPSGPPAWRTIPSWSLIGTQDHVIPVASQTTMSTRANATITTIDAGHLSLITRPEAVTKVIEAAAAATS